MGAVIHLEDAMKAKRAYVRYSSGCLFGLSNLIYFFLGIQEGSRPKARRICVHCPESGVGNLCQSNDGAYAGLIVHVLSVASCQIHKQYFDNYIWIYLIIENLLIRYVLFGS